MITPDRVTEFHREGWILLENLVEPRICAEVIRAGGSEYNRKTWTPKIFDWNDPTSQGALHRLLTHPPIVDAVEALLEAPARVYYGMLAVVPPGGGKGLPWHQDNQYSYLLGRALNAFIALEEITPERGGLWIAPRTHIGGVRPAHEVEGDLAGHREADIAPENGFAIPLLPAGSAVVFDRSTLHRSVRNDSDRPRYAYACQYVEEKGRCATDGEPLIDRPVARELDLGV